MTDVREAAERLRDDAECCGGPSSPYVDKRFSRNIDTSIVTNWCLDRLSEHLPDDGMPVDGGWLDSLNLPDGFCISVCNAGWVTVRRFYDDYQVPDDVMDFENATTRGDVRALLRALGGE